MTRTRKAKQKDVTLPPGVPGAPPANVAIDELHDGVLGVETVLDDHPTASTGSLSLVGPDAVALPDRLSAVLADGLYRAEKGKWVMRVKAGRVVAARHAKIDIGSDEPVTVLPKA